MSAHRNVSDRRVAGTVPEHTAARARGYTVEERRDALAQFFSPASGGGGTGGHRLGLGRALSDFQEWEIRSGRLADAAGSPWWMTVNGILVDDLIAAGGVVGSAAGSAPGPWREFLASPPDERQARLWQAHQHSIGRGVAAAGDLLELEVPAERAFIRLALGIVESAAAAGAGTSSGSLGRRTAELYPQSYPCVEDDLGSLRRELSEPRSPGVSRGSDDPGGS